MVSLWLKAAVPVVLAALVGAETTSSVPAVTTTPAVTATPSLSAAAAATTAPAPPAPTTIAPLAPVLTTVFVPQPTTPPTAPPTTAPVPVPVPIISSPSMPRTFIARPPCNTFPSFTTVQATVVFATTTAFIAVRRGDSHRVTVAGSPTNGRTQATFWTTVLADGTWVISVKAVSEAGPDPAYAPQREVGVLEVGSCPIG
jgi:hypothetical protein